MERYERKRIDAPALHDRLLSRVMNLGNHSSVRSAPRENGEDHTSRRPARGGLKSHFQQRETRIPFMEPPPALALQRKHQRQDTCRNGKRLDVKPISAAQGYLLETLSHTSGTVKRELNDVDKVALLMIMPCSCTADDVHSYMHRQYENLVSRN